MRAPLHREATVRLRVDDDSGALVTPDTTPTVATTDQDGNVVTTSTVSSAGVGLYQATIEAQSALGRLSCLWSFAVSGHARTQTEVVSLTEKRLVPLWRYREDAELADLSDVNMLRLADTVEDWMASALGFPVVGEYGTVSTRVALATDSLRFDDVKFPFAVRAVTIDGVAATGVEAELGGFYYDAGWTEDSVVVVSYEHGPSPAFQVAPPGDIERAAVILARYANRTANYPERARQIATEGSLITFSTPSPDRPTGLPEVDSIVTRYNIRTVI